MREFILRQNGISVFYSFFDILLSLLLIVSSFAVFLLGHDGVLLIYFPALVAIIFLSQVFQYFHNLIQRQLKRPIPTGKAILILLLTFVFEILFIFLFAYYTDYSFFLSIFSSSGSSLSVENLFSFTLLISLLSLFEHDLNAFSVLILNKVSSILKRRLYHSASDKRHKYPHLRVVGITGSFGKTSVKEFLSHLLDGTFSVLKTEKNTNTEMGIAKTILNSLRSDHEIFVCEMGAYHSGEIKICSSMAQPQIAVFTGLNEQHLALFGSIEETFRAKWELPSSLPASGLLVVNGDSHELRSRLRPVKCHTTICSVRSGDVIADDLIVSMDNFSFRYKDNIFQVPLVGAFHAVNVLMALVVAEHLGVPLANLVEKVKTLKSPDKTFQLSKYGHISVLDDSYNVNPDGLRASLSHLDSFHEFRKILFFPGILELGEKSKHIHETLGEEIAVHVDHAFFFDSSFSSDLSKGALRGGLTRSVLHLEDSFDAQIEILEDVLKDKKPTVILFESRGAEKVLDWIRDSF